MQLFLMVRYLFDDNLDFLAGFLDRRDTKSRGVVTTNVKFFNK